MKKTSTGVKMIFKRFQRFKKFKNRSIPYREKISDMKRL